MPRPLISDPDLTLDVLMRIWPDTIPVFLRHRMICVGCLITPFHTVTDACREHGLDEAEFRRELERSVVTSSERGD
jgi:hybrid cluster-associated redox disulfide protein